MILIHTNRAQESPEAVADLLMKVGWAREINAEYVEKIRRSWVFHDTLVFAKDDSYLVGYASAYSDLAFTTGMGELIVHPDYRRQGIAKRMLEVIEQTYPETPFYIKTFQENEAFFNSCGFKSKSQMIVLSKVTATRS